MGKASKLLGIILFLTGSLFGQTNYYISNSTGDDSNGGTSPESAWKSFAKLNGEWSRINPGDSILVKRGDYFAPAGIANLAVIEFPLNKSGEDGLPIVIGSYGTGSRPVISGENITAGYFHLVRISGGAYITIRDIEFRGGIYVRAIDNDFGAYHLKFLGLKFDGGFISFYNPYQPANTPDPNYAPPMHHIEVGYCDFYYPNGPDCINLGATTGYNWIHHNRFYGVNEEAIDIAGGDSNRVEYNLISGTGVNGMKIHSQFNRQKNTIIRGNFVIGTSSYSVALQNISGAMVHNNTFVGNGNALFMGWLDSNPPQISELSNTQLDLHDNYIENNIFHGGVIITRAADILYNYSNGTQALLTQDQVWDDNYFNNNIYYYQNLGVKMRIRSFDGEVNFNPSVTPYGQYSGNMVFGEITVTESNFNNVWSGNQNINSDLYANPIFVNPYWNSPEDYGDFTLQSNSPGVQSGKVIPSYLYDILGNPIPQNQSPDRGAFQTSGTDITPPSLLEVNPENLDLILLTFSETLDQESSEIETNYAISGSVLVTGAQRLQNGFQVRLTTTPHEISSTYSISVANLKDLSGNVISAPNNTLSYSINNDFTSPYLVRAFLSDSNSLILSFSESLDNTIPVIANNFSITPEIGIFEVFPDGNSKNFLLKTENHSGGNYSVTAENLFDNYGNIIDPLTNSYQYSYIDSLYEGTVLLPITDISVSSAADTSRGAAKIKDGKRYFSGDPNGRWQSAGFPQWILIDLGFEEEIEMVRISFNNWNEGLEYAYSIFAGSDTSNLSELASNLSSSYLEWSEFPASSYSARFLKIMIWNSNQSSSDDSIGVWEIEVLGRDNSVPVELLSFSGENEGNRVILNWITATETNNLGFEIERIGRTSDPVFEKIGFVEGKGNSTERLRYSFVDNSPPKIDSILYRLKQIDFDGSFGFSGIVTVRLNTPEQYSLSQNYPNPFNPSTTIEYAIPENTHVKMELFNSLGERIRVLVDEFKEAGRYSFQIKLTDDPSGVYLYRLSSGKFSSTKKLIFIK